MLRKTQGMFFKELPLIHDFTKIAAVQCYKALPPDWYVVVSDVTNSTIAIENGKYRDVNLVGVAPIVSILREFDRNAIPFVFGGDGVSLCVSGNYISRVSEIFAHAQWVASNEFGLELRAGYVRAEHIQANKEELLVGKLKVSEFYHQALFSGGGLRLAEKWLKTGHELITLIQPKYNATVFFDGLECRWQPVKSTADFTISLLVRPVSAEKEEYLRLLQDFLTKYDSIFSQSYDCPIHTDQIKMFKRISELSSEAKLRVAGISYVKQLKYSIEVFAKMIIGSFMMNNNISTQSTDWGNYKADLVANCDFRKYDDMIRMVISCTKEQLKELETWLEQKFNEGKMVYGIHKSDSALITCMVFQYRNEHIHFVDGNNGGYSLAAKDLKHRLSQLMA